MSWKIKGSFKSLYSEAPESLVKFDSTPHIDKVKDPSNEYYIFLPTEGYLCSKIVRSVTLSYSFGGQFVDLCFLRDIRNALFFVIKTNEFIGGPPQTTIKMFLNRCSTGLYELVLEKGFIIKNGVLQSPLANTYTSCIRIKDIFEYRQGDMQTLLRNFISYIHEVPKNISKLLEDVRDEPLSDTRNAYYSTLEDESTRLLLEDGNLSPDGEYLFNLLKSIASENKSYIELLIDDKMYLFIKKITEEPCENIGGKVNLLVGLIDSMHEGFIFKSQSSFIVCEYLLFFCIGALKQIMRQASTHPDERNSILQQIYNILEYVDINLRYCTYDKNMMETALRMSYMMSYFIVNNSECSPEEISRAETKEYFKLKERTPGKLCDIRRKDFEIEIEYHRKRATIAFNIAKESGECRFIQQSKTIDRSSSEVSIA